jgi:hypothetical protein
MEINLDETEEAFRGLKHYRAMIADVPQLYLIAVLQVNQTAGVARVDFRNPRSGVGHSGALIVNTIVQLNFVAIYVMIVRVVNL